MGVNSLLYHTDKRREVTSLMVTFRSCYVKAPKIRFLVTGSFVLAMVHLCLFLLSYLFYLLIQNNYWGAKKTVDNPSFLLVTCCHLIVRSLMRQHGANVVTTCLLQKI